MDSDRPREARAMAITAVLAATFHRQFRACRKLAFSVPAGFARRRGECRLLL